MELLDRYLKAVGRLLPRDQRGDILEELSENLRAEMEDREAELGRPLDAAEQEDILSRHGDPMTVAGRYRRDEGRVAFGRQWIGPVLFPLYVRVLGFNLGITTVVCAVVAAALSRSMPETVSAVFTQVLVQFTIVTLVFAAAEAHLTRHPDAWNPRGQGSAKPVAEGTPRVPRSESFAELVALTIFLAWLWSLPCSPLLTSAGAKPAVKLGPAWHQVYAPLVLLAQAGIARACISLFRPDWIRLRSVARLVGDVAWLAILGYFLWAGDWFVLADAGGPPTGGARSAVQTVNHYFSYALLFGVGFSALVVLFDIRRLAREARRRQPVMSEA
jgi:hypothetical protein